MYRVDTNCIVTQYIHTIKALSYKFKNILLAHELYTGRVRQFLISRAHINCLYEYIQRHLMQNAMPIFHEWFCTHFFCQRGWFISARMTIVAIFIDSMQWRNFVEWMINSDILSLNYYCCLIFGYTEVTPRARLLSLSSPNEDASRSTAGTLSHTTQLQFIVRHAWKLLTRLLQFMF